MRNCKVLRLYKRNKFQVEMVELTTAGVEKADTTYYRLEVSFENTLIHSIKHDSPMNALFKCFVKKVDALLEADQIC